MTSGKHMKLKTVVSEKKNLQCYIHMVSKTVGPWQLKELPQEGTTNLSATMALTLVNDITAELSEAKLNE